VSIADRSICVVSTMTGFSIAGVERGTGLDYYHFLHEYDKDDAFICGDYGF
jgi:hypothetical protein